MADSLEQLKADAAETRAAGQNCDVLVLRAIGLGIDTRAQIKETIGYGYPEIEKALERKAAEVRSTHKGGIDRFILAGSSGNGIPKAPAFNPTNGNKREPTLEKASVVVDAEVAAESGFEVFDRFETKCTCGREDGHGGRHWQAIEIDVERVRQLRAEGKTQKEICEALDVNYWTFRDHVARNSELKAALGSKRSAKKESVSLVGDVEVKPEPPTGAVSAGLPGPVAPVIKIAHLNSATGAQSIAPPKAELVPAEPRGHVAKIRLRYGEILLECDTPEEAASLISQMRPSMPKTIKRAWSREFESDNTEDGTVGLTYLYLISMLHDGMEEHEKDAVWTLIKYLKRMQANAEMEKEIGKKDHR